MAKKELPPYLAKEVERLKRIIRKLTAEEQALLKLPTTEEDWLKEAENTICKNLVGDLLTFAREKAEVHGTTFAEEFVHFICVEIFDSFDHTLAGEGIRAAAKLLAEESKKWSESHQ